MSSNRAGERSRFIIGFLFALAWVLAPTCAAANPPKAHAPKPDEACLACHGSPGMKSDKGRNISINAAKHAASAHAVLACQDCHTSIKDFPHPAKVAKVECATCHDAEAKGFATSAHSVLSETGCATCHGNVHELTAATNLMPGKCAECHEPELKEFADSIHGQAAKRGDPDAPKCVSCHGEIHSVKPASEPDSAVARKNLADSCAKCHSDAGFLSRHKIPVAHPVESYKQSVHGRAIAAGNEKAADCNNCHGNHNIYPARDERSRVNHWKVSQTCGECHSEIAKVYNESVHGDALKAGVKDAPACVDCHGEHLILDPNNPASPVYAANISAQTCGRCHSSSRLAQLYDLPADRVPSYADSYHGLALKGGKLTAANCASCHGVHNIFRSADARSTVNAANLPKTCGQCHAGADQAHYSIGPVHVQTGVGPNHPVVKWIRWTYWVLIPATLGFMLLHNLIDLLSKLIRRRPRHEGGEVVLRMNLRFRIAHWGIMASFPTLVVTGFALKFPDAWWAKPLLLWEAGVGVRGGLHRTAAVVMILATLYHVFHLATQKRDRVFIWAMLPTLKDATDILDVFRYNLGLSKTAPKFSKFNYAEKMEYLAFMWGTLVMAGSGFLLWFNNFTLRHFPKWITDAATAVHWYEAVLATFAILIWHFYLVIFDPNVYPMDTAWLDGKVSADHYRHARPGYFRQLEREGLVSNPELDDQPDSAEPVPGDD
ncbi:MAG TPA: cytochrome b/b6 domain-containing protein [Methylomirabilota bacterium]|nr:cytochrome b/b6 domain-containing protein [Terriglobales bacterium]HTZ33827.1 cytochrome b/b6 domain-containing protein [Methylomirabilota bacterium]